MLPLRLVIDSNLVISAALNPDGLQRTTILLAITKPARLYVSPPILEEYAGVLARPHLKLCLGSAPPSWLKRSFLGIGDKQENLSNTAFFP
jgi:predicted nucleic acid-binding protein